MSLESGDICQVYLGPTYVIIERSVLPAQVVWLCIVLAIRADGVLVTEEEEVLESEPGCIENQQTVVLSVHSQVNV
jgi:hypothetical protein